MNPVQVTQISLSYQGKTILEANADGLHDFIIGDKSDVYREGFLKYENNKVTSMFLTCLIRRNGDTIMALGNRIRDQSFRCTRKEIILYHGEELFILNKDLFDWIKNTEYSKLIEKGIFPNGYKCRTIETTIGIKSKNGEFEFSYDIETGECFSTELVLLTDVLVIM